MNELQGAAEKCFFLPNTHFSRLHIAARDLKVPIASPLAGKIRNFLGKNTIFHEHPVPLVLFWGYHFPNNDRR